MRLFSLMIVIFSATWLMISGARNEFPSVILAELKQQVDHWVATEQVMGSLVARRDDNVIDREPPAETNCGGSHHAETGVDRSGDPGRDTQRLALAGATRIEASHIRAGQIAPDCVR